ncbi:hypothetical protein OSB04_028021 [Centaurea solstitialis]|uniref:Uncharacterized protein n=1 Tax=Centaurea solstitialis TaxID=347529 RepID=A0AA38SEX3_9ASTR|nr:hypothetical protein OSB04_028021 [Centaurea solstitialis]
MEIAIDSSKCADEDKFIKKARFVDCYEPTKECIFKRYIWVLKTSLYELVDTRNLLIFGVAVKYRRYYCLKWLVLLVMELVLPIQVSTAYEEKMLLLNCNKKRLFLRAKENDLKIITEWI